MPSSTAARVALSASRPHPTAFAPSGLTKATIAKGTRLESRRRLIGKTAFAGSLRSSGCARRFAKACGCCRHSDDLALAIRCAKLRFVSVLLEPKPETRSCTSWRASKSGAPKPPSASLRPACRSRALQPFRCSACGKMQQSRPSSFPAPQFSALISCYTLFTPKCGIWRG